MLGGPRVDRPSRHSTASSRRSRSAPTAATGSAAPRSNASCAPPTRPRRNREELISEIQNALAPSSIAPGRKLEKELTGMTIEARSLGPATSAPNVTQHIGSVDEVIVIKAPRTTRRRKRRTSGQTRRRAGGPRPVSHHQELDQLTNYLRAHGRALKLGVPLKPPFLPGRSGCGRRSRSKRRTTTASASPSTPSAPPKPRNHVCSADIHRRGAANLL